MFTENLYEEVLSKPYLRENARILYVVSGYASPAMVIRQLKEYTGLQINLLIGMAKKGGLTLFVHEAFLKIAKEYRGRFTCHYVNTDFPVHSKTYAWLLSDHTPIIGFIGSANYSLNGFSFRQSEVLSLVDPAFTYHYYNKFLAQSINCLDPNVIRIFSLESRPIIEPAISLSPVIDDSCIQNQHEDNCVHLSLVTDRGGSIRVPDKSGLNWGQRDGREPNQAYIPIPSTVYKTDFFPERGTPFIVYTDDNQILDCVTAQDNGKALETYRNNSDLGLYFRRRLGVAPGDKVFLSDLDNYGRRDVAICKLDDENYFLNFNV